MRIIKVITEAANHTGVNKVAENPIEDPNRGEGDNKTITGTNTKATTDNLTPPTEAITIIIITAIIEAGVVIAMVVIITEGMDKAIIEAITITNIINTTHMMMAIIEAIIEAITITNIINTTHMMMAHRWNNMAHHVHFTVALTTLLSTV